MPNSYSRRWRGAESSRVWRHAARKTINAKAAGGKITSIKKVLEDGKTVFAAVIEKGGKQAEITVGPDGKLIDSEVIRH